MTRLRQLQRFFGGMRASGITASLVTHYQAARRAAKASAATINRETSALRRMFTLAVRDGHLQTVPPFPPRLRENPPRQGFLEWAEYQAVRAKLPPPYQDVLDFAYLIGWRRREITELLGRR
jgi:integrase